MTRKYNVFLKFQDKSIVNNFYPSLKTAKEEFKKHIYNLNLDFANLSYSDNGFNFKDLYYFKQINQEECA